VCDNCGHETHNLGPEGLVHHDCLSWGDISDGKGTVSLDWLGGEPPAHETTTTNQEVQESTETVCEQPTRLGRSESPPAFWGRVSWGTQGKRWIRVAHTPQVQAVDKPPGWAGAPRRQVLGRIERDDLCDHCHRPIAKGCWALCFASWQSGAWKTRVVHVSGKCSRIQENTGDWEGKGPAIEGLTSAPRRLVARVLSLCKRGDPLRAPAEVSDGQDPGKVGEG